MKPLILVPFIICMLSCEDEKVDILPLDCAGVEGGGAVLDDCGVCGGSNTSCFDTYLLVIYDICNYLGLGYDKGYFKFTVLLNIHTRWVGNTIVWKTVY